METRIATLLERQRSLAQTADRMAPGLADRLTAFVSRLKTGVAALRARAEAIAGQALHHGAGDGSRRGEPKRTLGRPPVVAGVAGLIALVAIGSGLVARRARPPVEAALTPLKSEVPVAMAASSSVLPSPPVDVPIPTAPTPVATDAPAAPGVNRGARPASREARASTPATRARARRPQPAGGDPGAPPVFTGGLAVRSNPAGGTVFLDRRRVGETPLRLRGVTAGTHVIWIESPGHARWTTAVQVNANKVVTVTATLEPRR
jgi:hypothetical protein